MNKYKKKIFIVAIVLFILLIFSISVQCGLPILTADMLNGGGYNFNPFLFRNEFLDPSVDFSITKYYVTIAVDNNDMPVVAFNSVTTATTIDNFLHVFKYNGTEWQDNKYAVDGVFKPTYIDSAVDSNNTVHFSFWHDDGASKKLIHLKVNHDNTYSDHQPSTSTSMTVGTTSIDVYDDMARIGTVHDQTAVLLVKLYKEMQPSTYEDHTVDTEPANSFGFADIAVDNIDNIHIVYTAGDNSNFSRLCYKMIKTADWAVSKNIVIEQFDGVITFLGHRFNSIDLLNDSQPAVSSIFRSETPPECRLRLAGFNGNEFEPTNYSDRDITSDTTVNSSILFSDFALDGAGFAHIVYLYENASNASYWYTTNKSGDWKFAKLDTLDTAMFPIPDDQQPIAMTIDSRGHLHVAFWKIENGVKEIRYMTNRIK